MNPVVLSAAVTGNKWTRTETPYIPETEDEIIEHSLAAVKEGASILHIHARDMQAGANGLTHNPIHFAPLLETFRRECPNVILEMSVGNMEGQAESFLEPLLALRPDYASFNLKGTEEETEYMFKIFKKYNVHPVFELFNEEMLNKVIRYKERDLFMEPLYFNLVFDIEDCGKSMTQYASEMINLIEKLPAGCEWTATRGGSHALTISMMAIALGGGIRTGLEDSIYKEPGIFAKNSAQLIARARNLVEACGGRISTPEETRMRMLKTK